MCLNEDATEYDLCIIGAGLFGCAAARHASGYVNVKVCLIGPEEPKSEELRNREIFGAHYDEGRICHSNEVCDAYQDLNRKSISRYRELERLSGIKFYTPSGGMIILEEMNEEGSRILSMNTSKENQYVELTDKELLKKRYPFMKVKEEDRVFLDDMGAGHISPRKMIAAQKRVAQMQGCRIINDIVTQVKAPHAGIHEIFTETRRIIKAKRVLLCPGAFINFKDFYPFRKVKTALRKETAVFLRIAKEESERLSSMTTIITRNECPSNQPDLVGSYILPPIQYPDGKYYLKIGHIGHIANSELKTLKEVKEWYQSKGCQDVINFYSMMLKDMLPGLKVEEISSTTCVTCDSPTGFPYIDRLTPTVTVAAIGNSRGAATSEEVGRLAAQLSITGKWDSELSKSLFEVIYEK